MCITCTPVFGLQNSRVGGKKQNKKKHILFITRTDCLEFVAAKFKICSIFFLSDSYRLKIKIYSLLIFGNKTFMQYIEQTHRYVHKKMQLACGKK